MIRRHIEAPPTRMSLNKFQDCFRVDGHLGVGCSVNTTVFAESNRAIAVSSIHVFIRLVPAFEVPGF